MVDRNRNEGGGGNQGGQQGDEGRRSGSEILNDVTGRTADALNEALTDAASIGVEKLTGAARDALEDLDIKDVTRKTKRYVRSHPAQVVGVAILLGLAIGLIMYGARESQRHRQM